MDTIHGRAPWRALKMLVLIGEVRGYLQRPVPYHISILSKGVGPELGGLLEVECRRRAVCHCHCREVANHAQLVAVQGEAGGLARFWPREGEHLAAAGSVGAGGLGVGQGG